ncbi:MAG TPA: hypothetical protein VKE96_04915 [Vicinamibacterales bacterium]|nr:hypothetical protein [Vicinamibacterales bacterium]
MMNFKRTATIALVGGALIAWLAGAATSIHPTPAIARVQPSAVDQHGAVLASEIARLHDRLHPTAPPRQPARNLFAYRAVARPIAAAAPVDAPRPAISEAAAVFAPAQPSLKLAGIAEDDGDDGPIRLAFISGEGQLFMVKEGEMVTPRYRVNKITADVVELQDVNDQTLRRLALR